MRRLRAVWRSLSVVVMVIALSPAAAQGETSATLVVDPGSVGGPCSDLRAVSQVSAAAPWCSVDHAFQVAPAGSTVYLRGGTYPYQSLHGAYKAPPRVTDYVTFEPYGYGTPRAEAVTINGLRVSSTGFLRFVGFHFVGNDVSQTVAGVSLDQYATNIQIIDNDVTGQGIQDVGANHVLIEGNYIHDTTANCNINAERDGSGVYLTVSRSAAPLNDIDVRANRIERTANDAADLNNVSNTVIEGNDISTISQQDAPCGAHIDAVQTDNAGNGPITIRANTFHDTTEFILRNVTGLTIENNLILRMDAWMQLMADPGARVVNNTWSGGNTTCTGCGSLLIREWTPDSQFTQAPFYYQNQMEGTTIENNIMRAFANDGVPADQYHEDYNILESRGSGPLSSAPLGAHTTVAEPFFADALVLAPGSIGIDAGDSAVAPAADRAGNPRWDDPAVPNLGAGAISFVDIGANEGRAAGAPEPTGDVPGGDAPPPSSPGDPMPPAQPAPTGSTDVPTHPATGLTAHVPSHPATGLTVNSPAARNHGAPATSSRRPQFALRAGSARPARHGRSLRVMVRCNQDCRVTATGRVSVRVGRGGRRRPKARTTRAIRLPRARVAVTAHHRAYVAMRLPARVRRLLSRKHRAVRVRLRLRARASSGKSVSTPLAVRLHVRSQRIRRARSAMVVASTASR